MKLLELLTDESKWAKHSYAVDACGVPVDVLDPRATKWCLIGGVTRCYSETSEGEKAELKIQRVLEQHYGTRHIVAWQDDPATTFEMVRQLLEEANV